MFSCLAAGICTTCMLGAQGGHRRAADPQEVEFYVVVGLLWEQRTKPISSVRVMMLLTSETSLQPHKTFPKSRDELLLICRLHIFKTNVWEYGIILQWHLCKLMFVIEMHFWSQDLNPFSYLFVCIPGMPMWSFLKGPFIILGMPKAIVSKLLASRIIQQWGLSTSSSNVTSSSYRHLWNAHHTLSQGW